MHKAGIRERVCDVSIFTSPDALLNHWALEQHFESAAVMELNEPPSPHKFGDAFVVRLLKVAVCS